MTKLGYIPPPLPGETVYSILAAYNRLLPSILWTPFLLGPRQCHFKPGWPIGLARIAAALPDTCSLDADQMIQAHTLLPLYAHFLSSRRRRAATAAMLNVGAGSPVKFVGGRFVVANPGVLRLCLKCVMEDQTRYGRAYWHRIHQAPGAIVCPHHGVMLTKTSITCTGTRRTKKFVDARDAEHQGPVAEALTSRDFAIATASVETFQRLMERHPPLHTPSALRCALRAVLAERGYVARENGLQMGRLHEDFSSWLSPGLAQALGIPQPLIPSGASWLCRLLTRNQENIAPLAAVLTAMFLNVDFMEILGRAETPVSHPRKSHKVGRGDVSETYAKYERSKGLLRKLWLNRQVRIAAIARKLGVNGVTVRRWAVALQLPFPRMSGSRVIYPAVARPHRPDIRLEIARTRNEWIAKTRLVTQGVTKDPLTARLYGWLLRYDRKWIREFCARPVRR